MILTKLQLCEGATLPRGYGVAWCVPTELAYVCLPIPFNVIAGRFRAFWLRVRLPEGRDVLEQCWRDGYRIGSAAGYTQGRESGLHTHMLMADIRQELAAIRRES